MVDGKVMWEDDLYHHYPSMDRVWGWLADAGFVVDEALEGPWDEEEDYAYHHVLAHAELG